MFFSSFSAHRYFLYRSATDMRKGFDGLCGLIINELGTKATDGSVYIFINKHCNKIKLLQWQNGGFVLYYKRLEQGRFEFPLYDATVESISLSYSQLVLLIDGVSIAHVRPTDRYVLGEL